MREKEGMSISGEELLEKIREKIITGVYPDGESLTEVKLAGEYGTSRTPIREALRRLEAEGLVITTHNKGSVAHTLTAEEISDVFNIRIRVESMAAYLAAKNITPEKIEELKAVQKALEENSGADNGLQQTDSRFHDIIYEAACSFPVKRVLQGMSSNIRFVRYESLKNEGRAQQAAAEHAAILEAIVKGDAELAEKLAYQHILNAAKKNKACKILPLGGKDLQEV